MAIDSKEKRLSMMNFGDGNSFHTVFEIDGTVHRDDRQHLLDCYSGISFQSIVVGILEASMDLYLSLGGEAVIGSVSLYGDAVVDPSLSGTVRRANG